MWERRKSRGWVGNDNNNWLTFSRCHYVPVGTIRMLHSSHKSLAPNPFNRTFEI